jgi:Spy/CpxP family protein refolding chaperone
MAFVLGAALLAAMAQAAEKGAGSSRRGSRMFSWRGNLMFLLRSEQVQKELKLNEEQTGKVTAMIKKLGAELREQYAGLGEITDREKRMAKFAELSDQADRKIRTQLRDVISREQRRRLYQIRMQVRGVVASLGNEYVARRLKLTDEQKNKVAEIGKAAQEKMSKAFSGWGDLSEEERGKRRAEFGKIRQKAEEEALGLLTAEQKESFKKMQGEKFELQMRRPRQ